MYTFYTLQSTRRGHRQATSKFDIVPGRDMSLLSHTRRALAKLESATRAAQGLLQADTAAQAGHQRQRNRTPLARDRQLCKSNRVRLQSQRYYGNTREHQILQESASAQHKQQSSSIVIHTLSKPFMSFLIYSSHL